MAKTALVTGASEGIGLEFCRLLARDGYELFLVARNESRLRSAADEMKSLGSPAAHVIAADLADPGSPARVMEELGGVVPDVLFNNAGFGMLGPFAEGDWTKQQGMIQVNVMALAELTHRVLPGMVARGSGRILNNASTAAFLPGPLMAVYYASKAFVLHFSEALWRELKGTGVTVTALCPEPTESEFAKRANMTEAALFKGGQMKVMSGKEVAEIGYRAMVAGQAVKIAGFRNRMGMVLLRLAPRGVVRNMVYGLQKPAK